MSEHPTATNGEGELAPGRTALNRIQQAGHNAEKGRDRSPDQVIDISSDTTDEFAIRTNGLTKRYGRGASA